MDLDRLRDILRTHVIGLYQMGTHQELPGICDGLGLPPPPEDGTKREKMTACFDTLPSSTLPDVAARFLQRHSPAARDRNEIQDLLWADGAAPEIPKRFRREVARAIDDDEICLSADGFDKLLDQLWVLDNVSSLEALLIRERNSLREGIQQHVHRNPGDWTAEYLFERLGALDASDRRFVLFLEGLISSDVRPDEPAQRRLVGAVNVPLRQCGVELRETDMKDGYPVFEVVSIRGTTKRRPKNLIFASSVKPDLRFRDAVNNDVEIVTNADKVLVYERPIGAEGLRWRDLQSWWAEVGGIADANEAKKTLYRRLRGCLPRNSPPQTLLFDAYHRAFSNAIPDLPALLPEVWLHWDPKTVKERGPDALLRFRMDFLLLLPRGIRVVVEVDGKHHYAHDDGRADPARYADMAAADRDLKLAGYEVFRFGSEGLRRNCASDDVEVFFKALFKSYGVPVPLDAT